MDEEQIKEAFRTILKEERANFWVDPEQHYNDHKLVQQCAANQKEILKNNEFVSGVRKATDQTVKQARVITVRMGLTGLIVLIGYALLEYIKEYLKQ